MLAVTEIIVKYPDQVGVLWVDEDRQSRSQHYRPRRGETFKVVVTWSKVE